MNGLVVFGALVNAASSLSLPTTGEVKEHVPVPITFLNLLA